MTRDFEMHFSSLDRGISLLHVRAKRILLPFDLTTSDHQYFVHWPVRSTSSISVLFRCFIVSTPQSSSSP